MQLNPSTENKLQLTFGIREIQVQKFSIDNSESHQTLSPDHKYTFEINAGGLVDAPQNLIGIQFTSRVFTSSAKDDLVCDLTLLVSFHIINFEEVVFFEGEKYIIPDPVMHHLIAMTLSTARGILFEKVQGTFLSKIVLPIIDVTKLHKKEI